MEAVLPDAITYSRHRAVLSDEGKALVCGGDCSGLGSFQGLVRDIFRNQDGVLVVGRPGTRTKRSYSTMRIPESVLEQVYNELSKR